MNQPLVSVILCIYNGAATVERALDSLVAQTYTNWELVCVDDGSTDESANVVEKYFAGDQRVRIFREPHRGLAGTINAAIPHTRGEVVGFLDADDWYEPTHLEVNMAYLAAHPKVSAVTGTVQYLGDPHVPDVEHPGKLIHIDQCVVSGQFFTRREVLMSLHPFAEDHWAADYTRLQAILQAGHQVARFDTRTYVYDRRGATSITKDIQRQLES